MSLSVWISEAGRHSVRCPCVWRLCKKRNFTYEILFLDANEPVLVKRYKETRRAHPLSKHGRINEGIVKEREKIELFAPACGLYYRYEQSAYKRVKA